jgi:hypothetical protein
MRPRTSTPSAAGCAERSVTRKPCPTSRTSGMSPLGEPSRRGVHTGASPAPLISASRIFGPHRGGLPAGRWRVARSVRRCDLTVDPDPVLSSETDEPPVPLRAWAGARPQGPRRSCREAPPWALSARTRRLRAAVPVRPGSRRAPRARSLRVQDSQVPSDGGRPRRPTRRDLVELVFAAEKPGLGDRQRAHQDRHAEYARDPGGAACCDRACHFDRVVEETSSRTASPGPSAPEGASSPNADRTASSCARCSSRSRSR